MPRHSTEAPRPVAYSYIRFSTPEQSKGDSLRRQTAAAADWSERNKARLDESTTLHDFGKSAFTGTHRKNADRHALAAFLKMVEAGRVPRGSFLVIENLDRLSREHVQPALLLALNLLQAGIRIVQLKPAEMVFDDKSDTLPVMMMMLELSRGHGESAMKSERIGAAWKSKKAAAREGKEQPPRKRDGRVTKSLTDRLPAWVQDRGGKLCLIPERAEVVKRIFHLAASGYGAPAIIKKLMGDGIGSFGRTDRWTRAYVGKILNERRVLGEYQPRDRDGKPQGEPICDYYPPAVSSDEWLQARAGTQERRRFKGRQGKAGVNIFAHLVKHARDGDTYIMSRRLSRRPKQGVQILVNTEGDQGKVRGYSLPYAVFETAILSRLREIDPHDILNGDHPPDETAALASQLVGVEAELADAVAFMEANGFSPTIGKRVADLEARKVQLTERLAEARQKAAHPLSESWGECQSLADTLAAAPDPHDARLRLRSALRRIADSILLLIVPRKQDRLAAVQVDFAGGRRRSYLIMYRPGSGRRTEGQWWVRSLADVAAVGKLDLRNRTDAARLEKALAAVAVPVE